MAKFQVTSDLVFPEVKVIDFATIGDERGFFTEFWSETLSDEVGMKRPSQVNCSESDFGVVRGIHWQKEPWSQGKLIFCIKGEISDIVVDIRKTSSTCGKHTRFKLDETIQKAIWIPRGFGHAFQALSEKARIMYFVDNPYKPSHEETLHPLDQHLDINWSISNPTISPKDLSGMSFNAYMKQGD